MAAKICVVRKQAAALGLTMKEETFLIGNRTIIRFRDIQSVVLWYDQETGRILFGDIVINTESGDKEHSLDHEEIASSSAIIHSLINGVGIVEPETSRRSTFFTTISRGKIVLPFVQRPNVLTISQEYYDRRGIKGRQTLLHHSSDKLSMLESNDRVMLAWIANEITDGMFLDYLWDKFNWEE